MYTPLWASAARRKADVIQYNNLVRVAYLVGVKVAADKAPHLSGINAKKCKCLDDRTLHAMAYAEWSTGQAMTINEEVGEVDAGGPRADHHPRRRGRS